MNLIHLSSIKLEGIPSRVRLFKAGDNLTSKGVFTYDPKNIPEIQANQTNKDGRDLYPIDVAHLSLTSAANPDAHISVGWFELSFEEDGIYANNIEWTARGKSYLENREFRFISPAFDTKRDNDGGEIVYISNFAITNNPATYNPLPLVASRNTDLKELSTAEDGEHSEELNTMSDTQIEEKDKDNEEKEVLEDSTPEEDKEVEMSLEDKLAAANATIAELQAKLAEYEQEKEELSKDSLLSQVTLSDKQKEFYKKLSLDQVREFVELEKVSKPVVEDKEVKEAPVVKSESLSRKKPNTVITLSATDSDKKHEEFLKQLRAEAEAKAKQYK